MQFYCPCLVQVGHTLHPTSSRGTHTVLLYPLTERNVTCVIRICINGDATFSNTDVYCKFILILFKRQIVMWTNIYRNLCFCLVTDNCMIRCVDWVGARAFSQDVISTIFIESSNVGINFSEVQLTQFPSWHFEWHT